MCAYEKKGDKPRREHFARRQEDRPAGPFRRDNDRSFRDRDNHRDGDVSPFMKDRRPRGEYNSERRFDSRPRDDRDQRGGYPRRDGGDFDRNNFNRDNRERNFNRDDRKFGDTPRRSFNSNFDRDNRPTNRPFRRDEGFNRNDRPRYEERPPRETNFNRDDRPRREGSYRPEGGFNRERSFNRDDRPRFDGGYNRDRNEGRGGFRRDNNFNRDDRPRREGGYRSEGGYSRDCSDDRGGYRRDNSFNRDSGPRRFGDDRGGFRRDDRGGFRKGAPTKQPFDRDNYPRFDPPKATGAIRLNRFVANSGICSRREADELIQAGVVSVNGQVVTELGTKVNPTDEVRFNDEIIRGEKKVYIVMNKPKGYVTSLEDPHAEKTVMDLLTDACTERVYPVGRLDKNSVGVLLFTNDGELTRQLTHPSYNKKKVYQVSLDKAVTQADMKRLAEGIELEDGLIFADEVSYVTENKKEVGIEIHSGRNRIVRRMFESMGYTVQKLDRVYFGGLTKKHLKRGGWRHLLPIEVSRLKSGEYE